MSSNKDSPSWIVYKQYFEKIARGQKPTHLYDGYQGPSLTVESVGPFSTSTPSDKSEPDVSKTSPPLPSDVNIISPIQANVQRVKDSLERETLEEQHQKDKNALLPPEGIIYTPKENPHLKSNREKVTAQPLLVGKRKKLSFSEIRGKLIQSPTWQKKKKKN